MPDNIIDATIVGAGVIGLAIAYELSKKYKKVLILEKQSSFGQEISSRNSEVIHAGIYYKQGSLKAKLCREGKMKLYQFCQKHQIGHKKLGKLIVAVNDSEAKTLDSILIKAQNNGVTDLIKLNADQIFKLEPSIKAVAGLYSHTTGIIDSHNYMKKLLVLAEHNGASIAYKTIPTKISTHDNGFTVYTTSQNENFSFGTKILINSCGLDAQNFTLNLMPNIEPQKIPKLYLNKGNYFKMSGKHNFKHLIYPVPLPHNTGLGVHLTMDLAGNVRFGPDTKYIESLDYSSDTDKIECFYTAIKKYYPDIKKENLHPDYVGIRPKLRGPNMDEQDFMIQTSATHGIKNLINLYGIESPGLTASLAIANTISKTISGAV